MDTMTETADTSYYDQPHIPPNTRAGLAAANHGKALAALQGDYEPILDRLLAGESASQVAQSLGINRVSLYAWLIRHCPEQWQAIAAARQLSRLDECEDTLDGEIAINEEGKVDVRLDGAIVTRARDKARMAQWHLERANRKLFGDSKQEGAGKVQIVIQRLDNQDNIGVTVSGDDRPSLPDIE